MNFQPVIDIVAKHLAVQNAQSIAVEDGDDDLDCQCRYRLERNGIVLMCAIGAILDGHVDVKDLEGLPASDIFLDTSSGFSPELAAVHDQAANRLKELMPEGMSTYTFSVYLDSIQHYHDAEDMFFGIPGPRYIQVLAQNLTEEEREARIRSDLETRIAAVTADIEASQAEGQL